MSTGRMRNFIYTANATTRTLNIYTTWIVNCAPKKAQQAIIFHLNVATTLLYATQEFYPWVWEVSELFDAYLRYFELQKNVNIQMFGKDCNRYAVKTDDVGQGKNANKYTLI